MDTSANKYSFVISIYIYIWIFIIIYLHYQTNNYYSNYSYAHQQHAGSPTSQWSSVPAMPLGATDAPSSEPGVVCEFEHSEASNINHDDIKHNSN